jgi:3-deoxy-D-manno-octulosonate 8-phosphate phosphatase (KDO 8-P phosphatase)
MSEPIIAAENISCIFCDFDGVLTDNTVYVDEDGQESVRCSRADGLATDALRALGVRFVIVSTETNDVVTSRARKLGVECFHGIGRKDAFVSDFAKTERIDLSAAIYVGNDLNDVSAMQLCAISICPSDSATAVKKVAKYILAGRGGRGVIRELAEELLQIDIHDVLYGGNN